MRLRLGIVLGCACLLVTPAFPDGSSGTYMVLPVPSGAPPPPQLPGVRPTPVEGISRGMPTAPSSEPGFGDVNVAPRSSFFGGGTGEAGREAPSTDELGVLEGLINRILELQKQALAAMDEALAKQKGPDRTTKVREVSQLAGTLESMLAGSTWRDAVERVRKQEDPKTTQNMRWLKIYGPEGHLDIIARQQDAIRKFGHDEGAEGVIGLPPVPDEKDGKGKGGDAGTGAGTGIIYYGKTPTPAPSGKPPKPGDGNFTGTSNGTGTGSGGRNVAVGTGTGNGGTGDVDPSTLNDIADVQRRIDAVGIEIAKEGLTKDQKNALEIKRNALVQRMAELARSAPGSTQPAALPPEGHLSPAEAAATRVTPTTPPSAAAPAAPTASVALVANSYGVNPPVLTDAEIKAIMDPLIEKALPAENAKLKEKGMEINKYRQLVGTSSSTRIISVGRPDYDHYREWIKQNPAIKAEVDARAAEIYRTRAGAAAPPPAPTPPASAPQPVPQTGGAPEHGDTRAPLPPGTTLPNGRLDLPSTSAR